MKEARKARVLEAYLMFESRLTSPEAREQRKCVHEADLEDPKKITLEDRLILENVRTTFDILGILVREDLMYRPLIFKPFYDNIIKCWKKAYDYIDHERRPNRETSSDMQDFEYLFNEAEKYRKQNRLPELDIYPPNSYR